MKKSIFISFFALIISIFAVFSTKTISKTSAENSQYSNISSTMISVIYEISEFKDRIAGSEDEKSVAEYIKNFLDEYTDLEPLKNQYISNGIQKFRFDSIFDGESHFSQNIIYTLKSNTDSTSRKKVILSCSYDSFGYTTDKYGNYLLCSTEGINQSAGSIALLLALAKYLPSNYDFDIEFIFFGASTSNNAGSLFYTQGISNEDAENILLAINFDTVALGENLYFYIDEIETELSTFSNDLFYKNRINLSEIDTINLSKTLVSDNGMGLNYTHIAQSSNNLNFMKAGVLSMNIFAGDYETGISIGRCEYENKETITFTSNDSLEYIKNNFGTNAIISNLTEVYNAVKTLISNNEFAEVCTSSFGETTTFYKIFGNPNLVIILTAVLLIIFIIICLIIHYKLTIKSYNTNIEEDFVTAVMNMSANFDRKSDENDITKNISEIVAKDIKKDKRIRKK